MKLGPLNTTKLFQELAEIKEELKELKGLLKKKIKKPAKEFKEK